MKKFAKSAILNKMQLAAVKGGTDTKEEPPKNEEPPKKEEPTKSVCRFKPGSDLNDAPQ